MTYINSNLWKTCVMPSRTCLPSNSETVNQRSPFRGQDVEDSSWRPNLEQFTAYLQRNMLSDKLNAKRDSRHLRIHWNKRNLSAAVSGNKSNRTSITRTKAMARADRRANNRRMEPQFSERLLLSQNCGSIRYWKTPNDRFRFLPWIVE